MFGKRVLKNTIVTAAGKVIVIALSFATLTLTTRYLGPEQYGLLGTVTVFLSFFAIFSDLGLSLYGLRELSQTERDASDTLSALFTLRVIMAVTAMLGAVVLANLFGYSHAAVLGVAIMAPTLIFNTATSAISTYFQQKLHMRYVALGEVVSKLASLGSLIFVLHANLGINAILAVNVFGSMVFTLSVFWFARKHIRLKFVWDTRYWKTALWLSIPLGLATVLNTIYYRVDTFMLSLLNLSHSVLPHVSNFQAVGLYSVPYRLIEVIMVFPGLFIMSVFPVMAGQLEIDDLWKTRVQRAYDALIMLAVPLVIFVWIFARQIIFVIAGPEFAASEALLRILIGAVAISFLNAYLGFLLVTRKHEKDIMTLSFITIISNVAFNLVLIPQFSYFAAAWMSALSEGLCFIVSIYFMWSRFRHIPSHMAVLRCLLGALVAAPTIYWLHGYMASTARVTFLVTIGAATLYAVCYFALLIPLRVLKINEIRETLQLPSKS